MKKIILYVLLFDALLVLGFTFYSSYAYRTPGDYAETTIIIEPRTGARQTLVQLHEAGLVPPLLLTALPVVISHQYASLKAGEYHFKPGLAPSQIIGQITRGEVVVHKVTIPEGWNSFQVRDALMKEPLLTGELPTTIAEGSVLPDTMHFSRGEARGAVLARMQRAQTEVMEKLWETRRADLPIKTPEQAIILASIVEKETGVTDERTLVAGVFTNRLQLGMLLQTDPSVVYGIELAQGGVPMSRALTRNDLKMDTPYNSYTRAGLPPTPICNPGRKAIEAALNPATTDALYFVATGSGGHHFAATLKEHEANVKSYRAQIKEDEPIQPAMKGNGAPAKKKSRKRH
jgi:UPF0755 protein